MEARSPGAVSELLGLDETLEDLEVRGETGVAFDAERSGIGDVGEEEGKLEMGRSVPGQAPL
jgi:hypothetical protein